MESPWAGQRSAEQSSWQWDEADGAVGAPPDVISGGPEGSRPSRRALLVGAAGVLAGGAALWAAFGRSDGAPPPRPLPLPTALEGPAPLWTYRGPQAMAPEWSANRSDRPVFLSRAGLRVLDPASGAPARLIPFDLPSSGARPGGPDLVGSMVFGPDRLFSAVRGRIDSRLLSDPGGDWSMPLPDVLGNGSVRLAGCDGGTLYGTVLDFGSAKAVSPDTVVFAIRLSDRSLLWSVPVGAGEYPFAPVTADYGGLPCGRRVADHAEVVVRDAADGRELWTTPVDTDLRWCATGPERVYVPNGTGAVRALGPTGRSLWTSVPAEGEQWRALPPVADGDRVYVPFDNGLVIAYEAATGRQVWSFRLPFLLDSRSIPLLTEDVLYVPGPAAGGVCAIDAATGRLLWTFRDSGPGKDVWSLAADDTRLFAGHDDVLHALPPAGG
ncbi:PQQ-binding-like beta-propeller repeat protein [Kitasatospora sp. NPDC056446]|uniref:outer membrane protein assembly factor BamB family protein n=1 Tax=Kitasatospora sp. NPDC056446 TaxID=3345819 RepID=UPI00368FF507